MVSQFADLNGDGNQDIISANTDLNTISMLLGNGMVLLDRLYHPYTIGTRPFWVLGLPILTVMVVNTNYMSGFYSSNFNILRKRGWGPLSL
ncbi:MAG: hypothetical protein MRQ13_02635 [Candidatus Midichloria sp.]|nr:hypothetical protein [Candidatus Midichloria sp.]